MFEKFIVAVLGAKLGKIAEFEPLAKHTTLCVGGPARVFVQPNDKEAFVKMMKIIREMSLDYKILGKGSNILASDHVYEGVVIQTDKAMNKLKIDGTLVTVGAGMSDLRLARHAARLGLAGIEFLSDIPGTIGGAVFMNAGAYKKEISDVLVKVQILNEENELIWLDKDALEFAYRKSIFQRKPDWVIVEAVLQLEVGNAEQILATMKKRKEKRITSQPLELPSAGSTFRNPEGYAAWELIANAGLRGYTIGGAKVSEKHTNFVVNAGKATAQDIADVIELVRKTVLEKENITLYQEVEFFNWS